jgi:hypothetical protein
MAYYFIVKSSTDSRYGVLSIEKTTSKKRIKSFLLQHEKTKDNYEFTFPDLAKENTYGSNFHRNIVRVYGLEKALPLRELKKEASKAQKANYGSIYSKSYSLDNIIENYLYKHAYRIDQVEDL